MVHLLLGFRQAQIPVLAALLLAAAAAKFVRAARPRAADAGLGPAVLFPQPLRRRVVITIGGTEFCCGAALVVTAAGLGGGSPATAARLATALLFIIAALALAELRTSRPGAGCGCFGDLSAAPVGGRQLARSALLACAGMGTIGLPPLHLPRSGTDAVLVLVALAAEAAVIAALSPELGEALVRLGYSEPCELRRLPAARTLAALRKSAVWRRHAGALISDQPVDMWRELCWRYVVFPARGDGRSAEAVFAVYLRPHRPTVHAALVDAATGALLDWPAAPQRRGRPATPRSPAWRGGWRSGWQPGVRPSPGPARLAAPAGVGAPGQMASPGLPAAGRSASF